MSFLKRAEKKDGRYTNPVPTVIGGMSTMLKVLPLYFSNREETEPKTPLGPFRTDPAAFAVPPVSGLRVTWFGHSALLLEIDGLRILVDPVWEDRASPVQFAGPKRFFAPTMGLEQMPELDAVLVSHDHYDHFGANTLRHLATLQQTARATWVTSAGVGARLERLGVKPEKIAALDWTQTATVAGTAGEQVRITAWPARHFSGRWLHDRFSTLWSSFVIEGPQHRVYFGADSGYWEGFAELMARYRANDEADPANARRRAGGRGVFDLTMLEIGAYHPLWSDIHMGPEGAARAYAAMGGPEHAGLLFPIHWGLFNLALHGWRAPIEEMTALAEEQGIPLWTPEPGVPTEVVAGEPAASTWWVKR